MEERLKKLVDANKPENRGKWVERWKKEGKKVIGLLCIYVPEEIISAAGILPWRVTGTWEESTPHASVYRPEMTCRYCSHVLESVLKGELDFLDGVVLTQVDDDFKRLWDVLSYLHKPAFNYIMYLPHEASNICLREWLRSIEEFKKAIENFAGVKITESELYRQMEIYNSTRILLRKIYELRKREIPSLTGAEALGLTTAARVMPKEKFNNELESLIPYLEKRKADLKQIKPRVIMGGEYLDNPSYVKLVEDCGSSVVMDEFDTGSKYFWDTTDISCDNPLEALAKRYIKRPGTARMIHWREQADQLIEWCNEFNADAFIELRQLYSLPLDYRFFFIKKRLEEASIPYLSLSREYHLSHEGMLRTRIEAFLEVIR